MVGVNFSGRLRKAEYLPAMIAEVVDVSNIYGWKYYVYNTNFPNDSFEKHTSLDKIYGISFMPADCETVSFTFLSNGRMVCPACLIFFGFLKDETERSYIYNIFFKTQFAGADVHQILMQFFKYLNSKYFDDFKLEDDSHYWETGDENLMRERFKFFDRLMDNISLSAQTFPIEPDEDIISYFERLMNHIDKLKT